MLYSSVFSLLFSGQLEAQLKLWTAPTVMGLYGFTIFFAYATVYFRTKAAWYGLLFTAFVVPVGGLYWLNAGPPLRLEEEAPIFGAMPWQIASSVLFPLFLFGAMSSPRIRRFCEKRE